MVDIKILPILIILSFSIWSFVFFVIEHLSARMKFANRRAKYTMIYIIFIFFIYILRGHYYIVSVDFDDIIYSLLSYLGLMGTIIYVALFDNTVFKVKKRWIILIILSGLFFISLWITEYHFSRAMHIFTILFFLTEITLIAITLKKTKGKREPYILLIAYSIIILTNIIDMILSNVYLIYGIGVLPLFLPFYFMYLYRHYSETIKSEIIVYNDMLNKERKSYASSIYLIVDLVEEKNKYLKGHSEKVSMYATLIGTRLGLNFQELEDLNTAALLHDIGYLGIYMEMYTDRTIINIDDLKKIQKHPQIGAEILRKSSLFGKYTDIILYHHENWDGTGYPYGLKGKKIPLFSRIIQIADQFDALTSDRFYRQKLSHEDALLIMKSGRNQDYDPELVDIFITCLRKGG